jgi:hypothetical protein
VPRGYTDRDHVHIDIVVLRIRCGVNKKIREETGKKIQYTLTILPSFLQPYSRFHLHCIIYSFVQYFSGRASNFLMAAVDMGAQNEKTFRKYYYRMKNGIHGWTAFIREKLSAIDDELPWSRIPQKKELLKYQWCIFVRLGKRLSMHADTVPGSPVVILIRTHREFVFAMLSQNRMGLGP